MDFKTQHRATIGAKYKGTSLISAHKSNKLAIENKKAMSFSKTISSSQSPGKDPAREESTKKRLMKWKQELDTNAIRKSTESLLQSIESTEFNIKSQIISKRAMAVTAFGNIEVPKESGNDVLTEELTQRAHYDIMEQISKQRVRQKEKIKQAQTVAEDLKKRIIKTKEDFAKKAILHKSKPEFRRHFHCIFGDILNVTALMDNIFAVFSSNNTIEIWMVQDDDSLSNQLCKLIQIEVDPISHIEHLYVESRFTPKNGAAATDTHAEGSKILAMKSSHIGAQSNTNTVDIVIDDENDDQFLPFSTAVAPKQNDSRKRQRVRNLFKYPNMKSEELANRKEICQELASNNLESLKSPSQFHALFFVGCFTGQGLIAEISWSIDVKTKKIEFEFSIICQKKLSQVPILFSKFQQMEDGLSIITTETVSASGDHFLQSFTLDLKLEWMCKCDVLILVAIDHANRTVSQNQYFKADHAVENLKAYEKMMITAICEDRYHKGLILALRNGSCVRVTYTRNLGHNPTSFSTAQTIPVPLTNQKIKKLNHFDAKTDKQTHGLNFTAANTDRLLKISWCVELFQKADEEMPYRNKNIHIVEDGTPTYIVGQTSERIGLSFINNPTLGSKPDDFEVISLKCIINLQNKKPQLIITGSDGLVRIFANNIEKILTRPLSVICFDKSVRSVDDTDGLTKVSYHAQPSIAHTDIITTRDTQLFTAFTNKSMLVSFDLANPESSTIEIQVVSNRPGVAPSTDLQTNQKPKVEHHLSIIDDKEGMGIIVNGKEWSILSYKKLMAWSVESKHDKIGNTPL